MRDGLCISISWSIASHCALNLSKILHPYVDQYNMGQFVCCKYPVAFFYGLSPGMRETKCSIEFDGIASTLFLTHLNRCVNSTAWCRHGLCPHKSQSRYDPMGRCGGRANACAMGTCVVYGKLRTDQRVAWLQVLLLTLAEMVPCCYHAVRLLL